MTGNKEMPDDRVISAVMELSRGWLKEIRVTTVGPEALERFAARVAILSKRAASRKEPENLNGPNDEARRKLVKHLRSVERAATGYFESNDTSENFCNDLTLVRLTLEGFLSRWGEAYTARRPPTRPGVRSDIRSPHYPDVFDALRLAEAFLSSAQLGPKAPYVKLAARMIKYTRPDLWPNDSVGKIANKIAEINRERPPVGSRSRKPRPSRAKKP